MEPCESHDDGENRNLDNINVNTEIGTDRNTNQTDAHTSDEFNRKKVMKVPSTFESHIPPFIGEKQLFDEGQGLSLDTCQHSMNREEGSDVEDLSHNIDPRQMQSKVTTVRTTQPEPCDSQAEGENVNLDNDHVNTEISTDRKTNQTDAHVSNQSNRETMKMVPSTFKPNIPCVNDLCLDTWLNLMKKKEGSDVEELSHNIDPRQMQSKITTLRNTQLEPCESHDDGEKGDLDSTNMNFEIGANRNTNQTDAHTSDQSNIPYAKDLCLDTWLNLVNRKERTRVGNLNHNIELRRMQNIAEAENVNLDNDYVNTEIGTNRNTNHTAAHTSNEPNRKKVMKVPSTFESHIPPFIGEKQLSDEGQGLNLDTWQNLTKNKEGSDVEGLSHNIDPRQMQSKITTLRNTQLEPCESHDDGENGNLANDYVNTEIGTDRNTNQTDAHTSNEPNRKKVMKVPSTFESKIPSIKNLCPDTWLNLFDRKDGRHMDKLNLNIDPRQMQSKITTMRNTELEPCESHDEGENGNLDNAHVNIESGTNGNTNQTDAQTSDESNRKKVMKVPSTFESRIPSFGHLSDDTSSTFESRIPSFGDFSPDTWLNLMVQEGGKPREETES
jgi:hypothetical protein